MKFDEKRGMRNGEELRADTSNDIKLSFFLLLNARCLLYK